MENILSKTLKNKKNKKKFTSLKCHPKIKVSKIKLFGFRYISNVETILEQETS